MSGSALLAPQRAAGGILAVVLYLLIPAAALACDRPHGQLALQSNLYPESGRWRGQTADRFSNRLTARIDCRFQASSVSGANVDLYAEFDTAARAFWLNPAELNVYRDLAMPLTLAFGYQQKPLGYLEAEQPNNLYNPKAWLNGPFDPQSIGRLAAGLRYQGPTWLLHLDLMPLRQHDTWTKEKGRFRRGNFVISGRDHAPGTRLSTQLRWDYFGESLELTAMLWHGASPQPLVRPAPDNPAQLIESYDRINQTGLSALYLLGAFSLKADLYYRRSSRHADIASLAAGLEWLRYGLLGARADLVLFLEGYYMQGAESGAGEASAPTSFDNDVFLGALLELNDARNSRLEAGILYDWRTGSRAVQTSLTRNLSDRWQFTTGLEWYDPSPQDPGLYGFVADSRLYVNIVRFF